MNRLTLHLICLAALATPLHADPSATWPMTPLSPIAAELQAQTINVAPKCVATTVGIVAHGGDPDMPSIESGSGVIISAEGLIMTAGHVISKPGNPLTIRLADGRVYQGVAVGLDHATDTGFARITDPVPAGGWAFSTVAPDDSARLGEWIVSTGNPGSIVVDRNPPLRLGRVIGHDARNLLTNCAIEPGDSGGPVFDLQGRVVGINSRIRADQAADAPMKEYLSMHVPVSAFSTEWKDLLAGENANPDARIGRSAPPPRIDPKALALRRAIRKLVAAKDPEVLKMMNEARNDGNGPQMTPAMVDHLIHKAELLARAGTQPSTAPSAIAAAPTTVPSNAVAMSPTTGPTTAPATGPAIASSRARNILLPTTQPATRAVQPGIPAELRPRYLAQLRRSLLREFPNANVTDAILNRILDRSSIDPGNGRLRSGSTPQDLKDMGISPEALAKVAAEMPGNRSVLEAGKTSLQTLALFAPSLDAAGDCVVEIRSQDKPVLLGTIVESDGYIVTKASDLPDRPMVLLPDGRMTRATIAGKDNATDLALIKVGADGLTAVRFAQDAPLGQWLSAPTDDPNQPAVGIVSNIARPIPEKFAHFAGERKIVLGIGFSGPSLVIAMITPGMPAEAAGIKLGDEIFEIGGVAVKDSTEFMAQMKKYKTGDTLSLKLHRDNDDLEFKPRLGQVRATTQTTNGIGEVDNLAGGKLSKRRTDFPLAIQTDIAIWANQCGGPLINLQGQAVGITVARYDRVCTFAIPAALVEETVAKLKAAEAK